MLENHEKDMAGRKLMEPERKTMGIKNLVRSVKNRADTIARWLFRPFWRFFPINPRKVVCFSFGGMFHADSPALITDAMLAKHPDLDVVWLVHWDAPQGKIGNCRAVRKTTWRALWEVATARIWISNQRMRHPFPKKRGQFYLQTWHAGISLKAVEWDAADTLPPEYLGYMETDNRYCDLMLSGSAFCTRLFRTAFRFGGEILECGMPRMDSLFHPDAAKTAAVRAQYGLTPDDTVVLYAPTFRQDFGRQVFITDFSELSAAFAKATGKRTKILFRLHPCVQPLYRGLALGEDVLDAMATPDIQDLYGVADFLVTDYSGSMFDFALLGKPVFLLMEDLEAYTRERRLYFRPEELPFPVARSRQELIAAVERVHDDAAMWKEKVDAFLKQLDMHETGQATRIAAERILREMEPSASPGQSL